MSQRQPYIFEFTSQLHTKHSLHIVHAVQELLDLYPQALGVFLDIGLLCVGCPTEAFHTLADVAREYRLDLNQLLRRIYKAVEDDEA